MKSLPEKRAEGSRIELAQVAGVEQPSIQSDQILRFVTRSGRIGIGIWSLSLPLAFEGSKPGFFARILRILADSSGDFSRGIFERVSGCPDLEAMVECFVQRKGL